MVGIVSYHVYYIGVGVGVINAALRYISQNVFKTFISCFCCTLWYYRYWCYSSVYGVQRALMECLICKWHCETWYRVICMNYFSDTILSLSIICRTTLYHSRVYSNTLQCYKQQHYSIRCLVIVYLEKYWETSSMSSSFPGRPQRVTSV